MRVQRFVTCKQNVLFRRYSSIFTLFALVGGMIVDSSTARHEVFDRLGKPKTKEDIIKMLGDQSGKVHTVFRENGGDEIVKTIAVGKTIGYFTQIIGYCDVHHTE